MLLFCNTGVAFLQHPIPDKPLLLLVFWICSISLLYIGLKVPQGTGRIFEKNIQKSPPSELKSRFVNPHLKAIAFSFRFCPCKTFFGCFLAFAKPNRPKTRLSCSTWISNCTSRTASSPVQGIILFPYEINAMWGFVPTRRASTHTQKQVIHTLILIYFHFLLRR